LTLQVSYDEDLDKVKANRLEILNKAPVVLDEPQPGVRADSWNYFSVDLPVWAWCEKEKLLKARLLALWFLEQRLLAH